jgi:hypothetical protein
MPFSMVQTTFVNGRSIVSVSLLAAGALMLACSSSTSSGAADAGSAASDSGAASSGGGTGAGCQQTFVVLAGMAPSLAACEEYLSASDLAQAETNCNGLGVRGPITYSWANPCPPGKIGGCKVPPGAQGGAPGGTIRWQYKGNITCAAGETQVNADGTPYTGGGADAGHD